MMMITMMITIMIVKRVVLFDAEALQGM